MFFFCEKQKARFLQVKPQCNEHLHDNMTYNCCSGPVQKIHEKKQIRNPRYVCGAGEERPEQNSGGTVLASFP